MATADWPQLQRVRDREALQLKNDRHRGHEGQGSVILYLTSQAALLRYLQAPRYLKPPLELLTVSSNRPTIISPDSEISQHARRPAVISPGSVISQTAPL